MRGCKPCRAGRRLPKVGRNACRPRTAGCAPFKFRDVAGHPLELLWFPPGQGRALWQNGTGLTLGIDHSALTVRSGPASLRFYRGLGFTVDHRSRNRGPSQSALDALPQAEADVIGLRIPGSAGAGLELLVYHPPPAPDPYPAARPGHRSHRSCRTRQHVARHA